MTSPAVNSPRDRPNGLDAAPTRSASARGWWLVALGVFVLGFALRLGPILFGEGLRAFYRYDSGVYFAAATGFTHGMLPYRDFLLLHPPGIVLGLTPFAWLGRIVGDADAMVLARLAFMAMGALTAVLVSRILRPLGWQAALVGGLAYACYGPAVYVERSTGLEALASFLTVAGLLALVPDAGRRKRSGWMLLAGGALLGLSATVKIWGVVLVLTVVVWLLATRRWAAAGWAVGGAGLAGVVVGMPFFAAAPAQFWQMVVLDQLGRPRSGRTLVGRTYTTTGLVEIASDEWSAALVVALLVIVACLVLAAFSPLGRLGLTGVLAGGAVLLVSPSWFRAYPALIAGFLAIAMGAAAAEMLRRARPDWARWVLVGGLLAAILAAGSYLRVDRIGAAFNGRALAQLAASRPGCVSADDPSALISSNLLSRNIERGCAFVVDLSGYQYHLRGSGPVGTENLAWQQFALAYLGDADTMLLMRSTIRGWLSEESLETIKTWPVVGKVSGTNVRDPSDG